MAPIASRESGVSLSTYLAPHEAEALRCRARAADRSVAAEIRRAIRGHLCDPLTSESPAGTPSSHDDPGVEAAGNVCQAA